MQNSICNCFPILTDVSLVDTRANHAHINNLKYAEKNVF